MAAPVLIILAVGTLLRSFLFNTSIAEWLAEKNEISSPITSWNHVVEGLTLNKIGISPYSGDVYHQMPLMLRVLNYFNSMLGPSIHMLFMALDLIIVLLLESIARKYGKYVLVEQSRNVKRYSTDSDSMILRADDLVYNKIYVVAAYFLNPYTITTCITKSTAIFDNFFIVLTLFFTLRGNKNRSCLCVALAAYLSLYPIMLLVPIAIHLTREKIGPNKLLSSSGIHSMLNIGVTSLVMLGILLYASFIASGSWAFLSSTYGFILTVPDLTPNMGVFWYFFTEMFEHFRTFFICVFQINAFIYTLPLAVRLRDHPIFLMQMLIALMAIFKSYPCYGDTVVYLALLPLWMPSFTYMRNNFVVACMFVVCTVLAPILYHLWIYAGSANANFYFAVTLAYTSGQIFLVTDLMFGYLRREFALENGPKPKLPNGKPAVVQLE